MNLTPTAWFGILAAIAAVVAAYFVGFGAGRRLGRDEGFSDGRREGAKEGSARGYAVGYDRGRRKQDGGGEEGDSLPSRPTLLFAMVGLILGGTVLFILSQMDRGPVERHGEPDINLPGDLLPPPDQPIGEPRI